MSASHRLAVFAPLWERASPWRAVAATFGVLALALLVAALVARPPPDFAERPVIAVLRDGAGRPLWAVRLARDAHQIAVDSLAPPLLPAGRDYQLWLEASVSTAPRPLGLLPQSGRKVIAETPANIRLLSGRGKVAVTLEAKGGSQQRGPAGPALYRGRLLGGGVLGGHDRRY